ncbi:MAG: HAD-IIIA family hydrolase [Candidatus Omnitrophica bacterium]|nr:HAD-IIIA family hydrolase [Candidatus Omnitrophota bacterium]
MKPKVKIAFLDRDGVINHYPGEGDYVKSWSEFKFIPGSVEGIKKLKEKGFKLFVVSNQSGVSRKLYSQETLDSITKRMNKYLKKNNATVDGIFYCTHLDQDNCGCRKPKPGLLAEALSSIDCQAAEVMIFFGDSFVDMKTAKAFGAKSVLLLSGKEKIANRKDWEFEPDYIFDNLLLAAHYICEHYG